MHSQTQAGQRYKEHARAHTHTHTHEHTYTRARTQTHTHTRANIHMIVLLHQHAKGRNPGGWGEGDFMYMYQRCRQYSEMDMTRQLTPQLSSAPQKSISAQTNKGYLSPSTAIDRWTAATVCTNAATPSRAARLLLLSLDPKQADKKGMHRGLTLSETKACY